MGIYNTSPSTLSDGQQTPDRVDSGGRLLIAGATAGTSADPTITKVQGAPSFTTAQATSSISPATALILVAARSTRRSVTITNITGTQPVYLVNAANATGATTGYFLAGVVGASVTIDTVAAVYATSPTAAQTIGVIESFG